MLTTVTEHIHRLWHKLLPIDFSSNFSLKCADGSSKCKVVYFFVKSKLLRAPLMMGGRSLWIQINIIYKNINVSRLNLSERVIYCRPGCSWVSVGLRFIAVLRLQIIELLLKYKAFFHYLEGTSMAETIMTCNASHQSYFRHVIARFYLSSIK